MKKLLFTLFVLFGYFAVFADTPFFTTAPTGAFENDFTGKIGIRFTDNVNTASKTITKLGAWVVAGSSHVHTITLYDDDDCSVIRSVNIDFNGLSQGYHTAPVTPYNVVSGHRYKLYISEVSGQDNWYSDLVFSDHTSDFIINDATYYTDTCHNNDFGTDHVRGPVVFEYTGGGSGSGGGGGCTGCSPTNFMVSLHPTMAGTNLDISVTWSNLSNSGVSLYTGTNGSALYFSKSFNGTTNSTAFSDTIHVPQKAVEQIKVSYDNVNFSSIVSQWGEQEPSSMTVFVLGTNDVSLSFSDNAYFDDLGYRIERATDAGFTQGVTNKFYPAMMANGTNYHFVTLTDHDSFARDQRYWWRAYSTNIQTGATTQPSLSANARPFSLPDAFKSFDARLRSSPTVEISWAQGSGWIQYVLVQASVGDTNNFNTIFAVPAGNPGESRNDSEETVGNTVYYRVIATNEVGSTYSEIKRVVIAPSVDSSTFWIDPNGNGLGQTNRATAAPNFANLNWDNIRPGAVVNIVAGDYNEIVTVPGVTGNWAGGTTNLPITFRYWPGNDPGSMVKLITLVNQHAAITSLHWDGRKNTNFVFHTTDEATNNCGIRMFGNTNVNAGIYVTMDDWWIDGFEVTGDYDNLTEFGEGSTDGMKLDGGGARAWNTKVRWNWIHDMNADSRSGVDGITAQNYVVSGDATNTWGIIEYGWNTIERVSDNFAGGTAAFSDWHDNILRDWIQVIDPISGLPTEPNAAHPDGWQADGHHVRMWNNLIYGTDGYAIYVEVNSAFVEGPLIWNNVIFCRTNNSLLPKGGIIFSTEPASQPGGLGILETNVVIAHNTFYGMTGEAYSATRRGSSPDGTPICTNYTLKAWNIYANNLDNPGAGIGFAIAKSELGSQVGVDPVSPTDVRVDWNNTPNSSTVSFNGTNYTFAQFSAMSGYSHNFSYRTLYRDTNNLDFRPLPDSATNMIVIEDAYNRDNRSYFRPTYGWVAGAYVPAVDTSLVCRPAFEVYVVGTNAPDATPFANDAVAGINFDSTNYPASTNIVGYKGIFVGDNQYLAITNCNQLLNMTNFTITVRGGIGGGTLGDAVFLDAGSLEPAKNGWAIGRDNTIPMRFWINDDNGLHTNLCPLPDTAGIATGIHFWGWAGSCVGSNLTMTSYYDGAPYITNTIANVSRITVAVETVGVDPWIAVGKRRHGHNTDPHEGFLETGGPDTPNGFPRGPIADIEIRNVKLNNDEVLAVYHGQSTGPSSITITHTITVNASIATVNVTVSPSDNNGQNNGTTSFARTYNENGTITLTAPIIAGANTFVKWQKDGVDLSVNAAINITVDANHTFNAVYTSIPIYVPFKLHLN